MANWWMRRKFVHDGFKGIGGIEDIIGGTHFIFAKCSPQKEKRYALHCYTVHDVKVYCNSHFLS